MFFFMLHLAQKIYLIKDFVNFQIDDDIFSDNSCVLDICIVHCILIEIFQKPVLISTHLLLRDV